MHVGNNMGIMTTLKKPTPERPGYLPAWWGRTIFRVDDIDALY